MNTALVPDCSIHRVAKLGWIRPNSDVPAEGGAKSQKSAYTIHDGMDLHKSADRIAAVMAREGPLDQQSNLGSTISLPTRRDLIAVIGGGRSAGRSPRGARQPGACARSILAAPTR